MTPLARYVIKEVCGRRGVDPADLFRQCRTQRVFRARIEVAQVLDGYGYGCMSIGRTLNKDHTTILYYLGRGKRKVSKPRWRKPRVKHLCFIKTSTGDEPTVPPKRKRRFKLIRYCGYEPRKRRQPLHQEAAA